VLTDVFA
jgi:hypothetical protein